MNIRFINFSLCVLSLLLLAPFSATATAETLVAVKDPEHTTELLQRFDNIVADPEEARQKANAQGQERAQFCFHCRWQKR